jgi:hypothetical protein
MTAIDPSAYLAGRLATAQRRDQLDKIDRQLAANRRRLHDGRDPWLELEAAERQRYATERTGHQQRLDRTEIEIMQLERQGRHWWTPAQTDRYVKLCRQRDASREWLAIDEANAAFERNGRRIVADRQDAIARQVTGA